MIIRIDRDVYKRLIELRDQLEAAWGRRPTANEVIRQWLGLNAEADPTDNETPYAEQER